MKLSAKVQAIRNRRLENMQRVNVYKMEHGCCMCGTKDPVVLLFHHTGVEKKEHNVGEMVNRGDAWEDIECEIRKCIVVCANDHLRIHYQIRHA